MGRQYRGVNRTRGYINKSKMPALDIHMIENLSRELHPINTGLMQETEVCPWSLFLLKGLMPHVPQMLPLLVSDPETRERAEVTFMSPEFQDNIEEFFVENIKVRQHYLLLLIYITITPLYWIRLYFD